MSRRPYAYTKMDMEDPEEKMHRHAQFLIHKVLEGSDSRRKPSYLRIRICKLKVKVGKRLKRLRKRMLSGISAARAGLCKQVSNQFKVCKRLFSREEAINATLPPPLLN